jgi:antitoxin ParD1/3/4
MPTEPATMTMNVSLPEPLKQYVDGKVSSGIYGSASEFVREAIREKFQREQANAVLTKQLLDGLSSGKQIPFTDGHFKRKKKAMAKRMRLNGNS